MKNSFIYAGSLAFILIAASCTNSSTDSKKVADNANDTKMDSSKAGDSSATASTTTGTTATDMKPDADFATTAADGGLLEVTLGKLAQDKAVSSDVKKFGAMMVKDHSMANDELKAAATAKNISIPATLSDKSQKKVQDLTGKTGTAFDKAYTDMMVSDHKEDIADFKKEGDSGKDPQLSAWAKGKVPILEHHLMMAEQAKKIADKSK